MELPTPQRPLLPSPQPLSSTKMDEVKKFYEEQKKDLLAVNSGFVGTLCKVIVLQMVVFGVISMVVHKGWAISLERRMILVAFDVVLAVGCLLVIGSSLHEVYTTLNTYADMLKSVSPYISISDSDEWSLKYQIPFHMCVTISYFFLRFFYLLVLIFFN